MAASRPVSLRVRKAVWPLLGLVAAMALVALASPAIAGAENVSSSNRARSTAMATVRSSRPPRPRELHRHPRVQQRVERQHMERALLRQRQVHRARRARHDLPVTSAGVGQRRHVDETHRRSDPRPPRPTSTRVTTSLTGSSCRRRRGSRWRCATPTPTRPTTRARRRATRNAPTCVGDPDDATATRAAAPRSWRCSCIRRASRRSSTAISCDDTHWCAALTIDSLECTDGFAVCNRQLRGTGQLRLHPARRRPRPGRRARRRPTRHTRRTGRRC